MERLELVHLPAQLVALALGVDDRREQVAVGEQQHGEHRDRDQPDLLVGEHGAGREDAGRDLPRDDRQVEAAHRGDQAGAVAQAQVADDQQEVEEVRREVDAEHDRRGRQRRDLLGPRVAERLEQQRADHRVRRERDDVVEHERPRRARLRRPGEHGGDRDHGRGRGPEQRHRERGGDERRADLDGAGLQRQELPDERQREQREEQARGLQSLASVPMTAPAIAAASRRDCPATRRCPAGVSSALTGLRRLSARPTAASLVPADSRSTAPKRMDGCPGATRSGRRMAARDELPWPGSSPRSPRRSPPARPSWRSRAR